MSQYCILVYSSLLFIIYICNYCIVTKTIYIAVNLEIYTLEISHWNSIIIVLIIVAKLIYLHQYQCILLLPRVSYMYIILLLI